VVRIFLAFSLLIPGLTGGASGLPANQKSHLPRVTDAFEVERVLAPPGKVSVLIYSNASLAAKTREAGNLFNSLLGRDDFQLIVVVDLRSSLAHWAPGYTRRRMQRDLQAKIDGLSPEIQSYHGGQWPRPDITAIPDFEGTLCQFLEWSEPLEQIQGVIYSEGQMVFRWKGIPENNTLLSVAQAHLP